MTQMTTLRPERTLTVGRFAIDLGAVLGNGSFGHVYTARDSGSGEEVAAKVINAGVMKWDKIQEEVRLMSRVAGRHEGIIGLRGAEHVHGRGVVVLVRLSRSHSRRHASRQSLRLPCERARDRWSWPPAVTY